MKQLRLADCNRRTVPQATIDHLVLRFLSDGLLTFNLVALPAFRQLVTGLQPGSTVISRDTFRKRMADVVVGMKKTLCDEELPKMSSLVRMANRHRESDRPTNLTSFKVYIPQEANPDHLLHADLQVSQRCHLIFYTATLLSLLRCTKYGAVPIWHCSGMVLWSFVLNVPCRVRCVAPEVKRIGDSPNKICQLHQLKY